jgi:CBS domain-containing protein
MKVADILKIKGDEVHIAYSWTTIAGAIERLAGPPEIGALVVSDDGRGHIRGIITEREIVRGLHTHGAAMLEQSVAQFMRHTVPTCTPEDTLGQLMVQMTRSRHRHLPVVRDGVVCGLVSIGDVVRHRLGEMQLENDVLRDMYLAHQ